MLNKYTLMQEHLPRHFWHHAKFSRLHLTYADVC